MAVPFRRTSKMKKRTRRTHFKLSAPGTQACPSCGETKKMHRVCPHCGSYKGKSILANEE